MNLRLIIIVLAWHLQYHLVIMCCYCVLKSLVIDQFCR
uniref:Uncharacterized protein n=1 Tax=Arundo donax TaxID=35708 RepID=A0A0A8ZS18_ARUDO